MDIKIIETHKSINRNQSVSLPRFCILTGKNGSGKSHFLEALSKKENAQVTEAGRLFEKVRYIAFNGLNPNVNETCDYNTIISQIQAVWQTLSNVQKSYQQNLPKLERQAGLDVTKWILNNISDANHKKALTKIAEAAKIPIDKVTQDDIRKHLDFGDLAGENLFASQFATVFKAYHTRREDNRYLAYLNEKYKQTNLFLSEEDFEKTFGPSPWQLINNILEAAHLPYRVNDPEGTTKESTFSMQLADPQTNIKISVNDLSTGEKVLMSLALAIYNSTEGGGKIQLLLLDEPDAALHPEFSKFLVDTLREHIVEKAGVNVVISTHSPTTVAMAKGIDIFEMTKEYRWPVKSTQGKAIEILTAELRGIKVSTETRRQVFVESQYDVAFLEKIYKLLPSQASQKYNLEFLAPHSRLGSNCQDVINIVTQLENLGNDLVFGLIDFDGTNISTNRIKILGNSKRYAIENYIFDPIFVALILVRMNNLDIKQFNFPGIHSYVDCINLTQQQIQVLVDFVLDKFKFDQSKKVDYTTVNGMQFSCSEHYFIFKGHSLETKILELFPVLNSIKKGRNEDNLLKDHFLDTVINEFRHFLSMDLKESLYGIG